MWVITRGNIRVGRVVLSLGTPVPAASTSLEKVAAVWRCSHREPDSRSGMFASGRAETVRQGVLAAAHARSCRIADRETPCLSRPSAVHSTKRICVTSSGVTYCISRISAGVAPPPQRVYYGTTPNRHCGRGGQPLEVQRGLPGFQLSRFPGCTCVPQRWVCRGGAAPTRGRGTRRPAVGTGVAARAALGAWAWPATAPAPRVTRRDTRRPARAALCSHWKARRGSFGDRRSTMVLQSLGIPQDELGASAS